MLMFKVQQLLSVAVLTVLLHRTHSAVHGWLK